MALVTIGTNAVVTWSGFQWQSNAAPDDVASINNAIKTQGAVQRLTGGFANNGMLVLPNRRGPVLLIPGDWIIISSTGMPIVVSNRTVVADMTHG